MAVVTPLNNFLGPEGDTVTVDEQLLNTQYSAGVRADTLLARARPQLSSDRSLSLKSPPERATEPSMLGSSPDDDRLLMSLWLLCPADSPSCAWPACLPMPPPQLPATSLSAAPETPPLRAPNFLTPSVKPHADMASDH